MSTDCNHNKIQHGLTKTVLLDPWQNDSINSRPRSYSLGCYPSGKFADPKQLLSERDPFSSLEISLGSIKTCPKRKSSSGHLKRSILVIAIICLICVAFMYGYFNLQLNNFLASVRQTEEVVTDEQLNGLASEEIPVDDVRTLEEIDEVIPQRISREAPLETDRGKPVSPRVFVGLTQEDSNLRRPVTNSRMQHSHLHHGSNYGHSFVQRHHYPQHAGVYYAPSHTYANRMHAENQLRAYHNELARQSWLVEHMRHQQNYGRVSSHTWEAPVKKNNEQMKHVSGNKETEIETNKETARTNEENNKNVNKEQTTT